MIVESPRSAGPRSPAWRLSTAALLALVVIAGLDALFTTVNNALAWHYLETGDEGRLLPATIRIALGTLSPGAPDPQGIVDQQGIADQLSTAVSQPATRLIGLILLFLGIWRIRRQVRHR